MKSGNACHTPPVPVVLSYEEKDAGGECNLKKFLDLSGLPFVRESCYPVRGDPAGAAAGKAHGR